MENPLQPALSSLDQQQFGVLIEAYRRELQAHCYRMMGGVQDAEDMVQETFLRAWRGRRTFEGRATLRAWLYQIATHICLDTLKKRPRRAVPVTREAVSNAADAIPAAVMEPIWLEPYPDDLLMHAHDTPEEHLALHEHITMAFIAALHRLPPRQRAILILRDVLEWSASEVAVLLEMSIAAVKSALHRARTTLAQYESAAGDSPHLDDIAQTQLDAYVQAWETADIESLLVLLKRDATFSMPPTPSWYRGQDEIRTLMSRTIFSGQAQGRWQLLPTRANHQIAFGLYRQTETPGVYAGYGIQVLTYDGPLIADITTFRHPSLMPTFHLPATLP